MITEFSWDICNCCNFKCDYCFFSQSGIFMSKNRGYANNISDIKAAWDRIYAYFGPVRVVITGGEPFLYPGLTEIVDYLKKNNTVHISTNASTGIDCFIDRQQPDSIDINCTFHPQYISISEFINNVRRLKNAGFICSVSFLAHPVQLREMVYYKRLLAEEGFDMNIQLFQGMYEDGKFPESYNKLQKELIEYTKQCGPSIKKDIKFIGKNRITGSEPVNRYSVRYNGDIYFNGNTDDCMVGNIYTEAGILR